MQIYNILKINNLVPPVPASITVTQHTLEKNSYRAASGLLLRNLLTKKMKFQLTFPATNKIQLQEILNLISEDSFEIEYENILNNEIKTGTFFHSGISFSPYWIKNESNTEVLYNPFSISLEEY